MKKYFRRLEEGWTIEFLSGYVFKGTKWEKEEKGVKGRREAGNISR